jgi:hypothetical protein
MPVRQSDAELAALATFRQVRSRIQGKGKLWPEEFKDDYESAWRFILCCTTWNEAEKEDQPFPDRSFLLEYCWWWYYCLRRGLVLVCEKCRRMVISWCARALELYQMGLSPCDLTLCGEDLEAAAKHVWRLERLYSDLMLRFESWKLPPYRKLRYDGDKMLSMFGLANGSECRYANGQSEGLQGDGKAVVTMEEFGIYRHGKNMLFQAKTVTKGSPSSGKPGGFVNIITNASHNPEWQSVKKERRKSDVDRASHPGITVEVLPGGEIYLKIHHYADETKGAAWLEAERKSYALTPQKFDLEILMDDLRSQNALWKREWYARSGFRLALAVGVKAGKFICARPTNVREKQSLTDKDPVKDFEPIIWQKIVVALDPTISDPEAKKNPDREMDECGIVVCASDIKGRGYVLADFTGRYSPDQWAKLAVLLYDACNANEIVAEGNQGGELVRRTLKTVRGYEDRSLPVKIVHARIGKRPRAEPLAALYQGGYIHHCGDLSAMESEMATWDSLGGGKSPGRIDAAVWGFDALGLCRAQPLKKTQHIHGRE